jgi:hypothetical protein
MTIAAVMREIGHQLIGEPPATHRRHAHTCPNCGHRWWHDPDACLGAGATWETCAIAHVCEVCGTEQRVVDLDACGCEFKPGCRVIFPDGVHVGAEVVEVLGGRADGRTIRTRTDDGAERWAAPSEVLHADAVKVDVPAEPAWATDEFSRQLAAAWERRPPHDPKLGRAMGMSTGYSGGTRSPYFVDPNPVTGDEDPFGDEDVDPVLGEVEDVLYVSGSGIQWLGHLTAAGTFAPNPAAIWQPPPVSLAYRHGYRVRLTPTDSACGPTVDIVADLGMLTVDPTWLERDPRLGETPKPDAGGPASWVSGLFQQAGQALEQVTGQAGTAAGGAAGKAAAESAGEALRTQVPGLLQQAGEAVRAQIPALAQQAAAELGQAARPIVQPLAQEAGTAAGKAAGSAAGEAAREQLLLAGLTPGQVVGGMVVAAVVVGGAIFAASRTSRR